MLSKHPKIDYCPICESKIPEKHKIIGKRNSGPEKTICDDKHCRKVWLLIKGREWFKHYRNTREYSIRDIHTIDNYTEEQAKKQFDETESSNSVILDNGDIVDYSADHHYYSEDENDDSGYWATYGEIIKKPSREYIQNIRAEFLAKKQLEGKIYLTELKLSKLDTFCNPCKTKLTKYSYEKHKCNSDALRNHGWSDLLLSGLTGPRSKSPKHAKHHKQG